MDENFHSFHEAKANQLGKHPFDLAVSDYFKGKYLTVNIGR
jgi:hypothetical protein